MAPTATGSADSHRAAAADLDRVAQARAAVRAADENLTETLRAVLSRRDATSVTVEQVAKAAGITRRGVYARIGSLAMRELEV